MPRLDAHHRDYREEMHYLCSIVPQQYQATVHRACEEDMRTGVPWRAKFRMDNRHHFYELPKRRFVEGKKLNLVFRFLVGNGIYTAPTLDTSPLKTGKVNRLYPAHDFIVRLVDEETKSIWNVTLPHHILFPGFVKLEVIDLGKDTGIVVTGVGRGNLAELNQMFLGPLLFTAIPQLGAMMFQLEERLQDLSDRAAETVYGWKEAVDAHLAEFSHKTGKR